MAAARPRRSTGAALRSSRPARVRRRRCAGPRRGRRAPRARHAREPGQVARPSRRKRLAGAAAERKGRLRRTGCPNPRRSQRRTYASLCRCSKRASMGKRNSCAFATASVNGSSWAPSVRGAIRKEPTMHSIKRLLAVSAARSSRSWPSPPSRRRARSRPSTWTRPDGRGPVRASRLHLHRPALRLQVDPGRHRRPLPQPGRQRRPGQHRDQERQHRWWPACGSAICVDAVCVFVPGTGRLTQFHRRGSSSASTPDPSIV